MLKRYVFFAEDAKKYLLLECRNNREERLDGLSFTLIQYDVEGNVLSCGEYSRRQCADAEETFLCEKIEVDPACADFSVEKMCARFGVYAYSMRGGELAVGYSATPASEPASEEQAEERAKGNRIEGFSVAERKTKYSVAIGIFACITLLCVAALLLVQLFAFKSDATTFMQGGVVYSFVGGEETEGCDIYVSGYNGRGRGNAVIPAEIEGHTVTYVAANAFRGNDKLKTIRFEGEIRIEPYAFVNCDSLRSADFENVTSVGESAFLDYENLQEVRSSTIKTIERSAFGGCTNLKTIKIEGENRRISIGGSAFYGCTSLQKVEIQPFIQYSGITPFFGCYGLEELYLHNYQYSENGQADTPDAASSLAYLFIDDGQFSHDGLRKLRIGYMDCIPNEFCMNYVSLESVTVDHLTSPAVGEFAFAGCVALDTFNSPAVAEVGVRAFSHTSLDTFDGSGLVSLGDGAFAGAGISSVSFEGNETLAEIPPFAFENSSLGSIVLPDCVKVIRNNSFHYCESLEEIVLPDGLETIEDYAFAGCSSLLSLEVPSGIESLGYGIFGNCTGLNSLTMPFLGHMRNEPACLSEFFDGTSENLRSVVLTEETALAAMAKKCRRAWR